MREKSDAEGDSKKKRVDLSVPQVAGSAVAAVVAAKLASYFGVYGTILGAGVVSAIATCGGTVFQHFLKRTGEQLRDVTVQVKPKPQQALAMGEFTEGTVYRARVRSWKRPVVAAALVFGVTMTGITTYELVSGRSFSGDGKSTTVGDAFTSNGSPSGKSKPSTTPSTESSSSEEPSSGDSSAGTGTGTSSGQDDDGSGMTSAPMPSSSASSEAEDTTPTPTPSSSATPTSPAPDASSHSRSADPDQADPSAR